MSRSLNNQFILVSLATLIVVASCPVVFAQIDLYIDIGHGGDDPGAPTHITGYREADINLEVGLLVKQTLEFWGILPSQYHFSRLTDTTVLRTARAYEANNLNAQRFISIHHNSAVICPAQRTEVLYSEILTCDNGEWQGRTRDTSTILSTKLGHRINNAFNYGYPGGDSTGYQHTVLTRTFMESAITEASFICDTNEANNFYYNIGYHR